MTLVSTSVTLVMDERADVGEGPLWDHRTGLLYWVDITPGRLHVLDRGTGSARALDVGQSLGSVALRESSGIVLALRDGLCTLELVSAATQSMVGIDADAPGLSPNDSACDRVGRLWVGSDSDDEKPGSGCIYRVDANLNVYKAVERTTLANGIGGSPDDRTMYFVDSMAHTVSAFDYDLGRGQVSGGRTFVRTEEEQGLPDGLTDDEEGFVWVAYWGGWCVRRYSPEGRLDRVLELPVAQVSSCTFGGEKLDELYITTAAYGLSGKNLATQPAAGSLFRARPGVRGLTASLFRGDVMTDETRRSITWDHPRGLQPLVAVAARYAGEYPGVRVEWDARSLQAFDDQSLAELATSDDLLMIDHPHVGGAVSRTAWGRSGRPCPGRSSSAHAPSQSARSTTATGVLNTSGRWRSVPLLRSRRSTPIGWMPRLARGWSCWSRDRGVQTELAPRGGGRLCRLVGRCGGADVDIRCERRSARKQAGPARREGKCGLRELLRRHLADPRPGLGAPPLPEIRRLADSGCGVVHDYQLNGSRRPCGPAQPALPGDAVMTSTGQVEGAQPCLIERVETLALRADANSGDLDSSQGTVVVRVTDPEGRVGNVSPENATLAKAADLAVHVRYLRPSQRRRLGERGSSRVDLARL
jgi:sugar lactone lactonase YvrE